MKGSLSHSKSHEVYELSDVSVVGRSSECSVVIADQRVSRRHAMIRKQENGFWLFDLGSFNGSYLNGSRVTAARQLCDGDVLNFADHEFHYTQSGSVTQELEDLGGSTIALIRSRSVAILVSDIKGFTSLSEQLSPDDLALIIGKWYGDCELILSKYGATVDKFIGDCVLAYWTEINEKTLTNAVRAAKDLLASCHQIYELNQEVFDSAGRKFGAGVALHCGKVAYGGMSQREFTLVGDPVNLTFRVEALTRELDSEIVATKDFVESAPGLQEYCQNLGVHEIKGRANRLKFGDFTLSPRRKKTASYFRPGGKDSGKVSWSISMDATGQEQ